MAGQGTGKPRPVHKKLGIPFINLSASRPGNNGGPIPTYKMPSSASAQDLGLFDANTEELKNERQKRPNSGWKRFLKLWQRDSVKKFSISALVMPKRKSKSAREYVDISSTWKAFTLAELQAATNNFSPENVIGKGGCAEVYKGCLHDGQLVAVKRLNKGLPDEQVLNFLSEVGIIAHIEHPNTTKMIGYGVEGGAHLVLNLSPLGSLHWHLHDSEEKLDWSSRYKIIIGIAEGLLYLHENCQRRIIHRDIKADNILLSEDYDPQICDFGLSKWLPKQWSHHNATKFEGTFGYLAPEYFMDGIVDEKTDIFSYGVLLLEIISGRQAVDNCQKSLLLWAKPLLERNAVEEVVEPCLHNKYDEKEMDWVIFTASKCVDHKPLLRPRISQVITLLKGNEERPKGSMIRHERSTRFQRTYSEEFLYAEEYNSTKSLMSNS